MSDYSSRMKLIGSFYQVAIDPLNFDDLLAEWDRTIRRSLEAGAREIGDTEVMRHAERAAAILRQIQDAEDARKPLPLAEIIAHDPNPAMVLSRDGRVVTANQPATDELRVRAGVHLRDLADAASMPPEKLRRLLEAIAAEEEGAATGITALLELAMPGTDATALFAVSRIRVPGDPTVACLLTSLAPVWSPRTLAALRDYFELTPAEIEIVKLLVGGSNAAQISEARQTSLHTVRSQIKSILLKTRLESQMDLVRHLGFLQRYERKPHENAPADDSRHFAGQPPQHRSLALRNGNSLAWTEIGPATGTPVLFIHGLIDDTSFTQPMIRGLFERGIRLIAPSRPCFGGSSPYKDQSDALAEFADCAVQLLDRLGIEETVLFGHMAGTLYAIVIAGRFPQRVKSILSVAGAVPMAHHWQFSGMSTGHRIAGLTARHAPLALPLLADGGIRLLRLSREDLLLDLLFRDAPHDRELARNEEIAKLIFDRFHFVTRQGHQAFLTDVLLVSGDWSPLMRDVACPLVILHGEHDRTVLVEGVRDFVGRHSNCTLHVSPNSGQLLLLNETDLVLDRLQHLLCSGG